MYAEPQWMSAPVVAYTERELPPNMRTPSIARLCMEKRQLASAYWEGMFDDFLHSVAYFPEVRGIGF